MVVAPLSQPPPKEPRNLGPSRLADYLSLPDEPRTELIYGRLLVTAAPFYPHQAATFALALRLDRLVRPQGGKIAVAPLDVVLAEHSVVQPDIVYISRERREILGGRVEGAPDLLVEVISPGTERRDRDEKLDLYLRSGVREYWIVDTAARHITFLVHRGGLFVVALAENEVYRSTEFPEISLDLADFWNEVAERLA